MRNDCLGGASSGHRFVNPPTAAIQSCLAGFSEFESLDSRRSKATHEIPLLSGILVFIRDVLDDYEAVKKYEWMDPFRYRRYSTRFQRILPAIRITWQDGQCWIAWIHLDIVLEPLPADIEFVKASLARRNVPLVNIDRHHINQFMLAQSERHLRQQEDGHPFTGRLTAACDRTYQLRLASAFRAILRDAGAAPPKCPERVERGYALHDQRSLQVNALRARSQAYQRRPDMTRPQQARRPVSQASLL